MAVAGKRSIGVLTSGGDAPGMNAAVRAVVRTGLEYGFEVYAVREGYEGMVRGGDLIRPMTWDAVGGILHRGGTVIGTTRSDDFRERAGRVIAARNLVQRDIDALVVIGGDGSLAGADELRSEWSELLAELVERGEVEAEQADAHEALTIVGLVGSIDNDMMGTDITIGALTALHRITEAVDALGSTAASHQRTFVVEVMGRHCGWLALMGTLASGADWFLIPESPPDVDDWEDAMCRRLRAGREAGRRDSIVIVAEGAIDRDGKPIDTSYVKKVLEERLGQDVRETILGHVQRGGSPCAYDRNVATVLGYAAVKALLDEETRGQAQLIGMQENRVTRVPLMASVEHTRGVAKALADRDFDRVMELRGRGFREGFRTARTLLRALPHEPVPGRRRLRLAVLNAGSPAPGMNTAVRTAVRLGLDRGHEMIGVENGVRGLVEGRLDPLAWMDVNGWARRGGSELGTNRMEPTHADFHAMARTLEDHRIDGLCLIGGWFGYLAAHALHERREDFPAFDVPIACVPASITNNLPGTELCIGSDTALNSIVWAVDAIKQSAVASQRTFVVEVMGYYCGYLALLGGLATGAERVYLHETGVTLADLVEDVVHLVTGFERGKRLGLVIRNENSNEAYDTDFMVALFEEEGGDLFEVRKSILGHLQQGGDPSPYDRILATRLATRAIEWLDERGCAKEKGGAMVGITRGKVEIHDLEDLPRMIDRDHARPKEQWWMSLRSMARLLAQPAPSGTRER